MYNIVDRAHPGDVIAWNNMDDVPRGVINHAGIVSDVIGDNIYYCGNTTDRSNAMLYNNEFNGDIYIVHVKYRDE